MPFFRRPRQTPSCTATQKTKARRFILHGERFRLCSRKTKFLDATKYKSLKKNYYYYYYYPKPKVTRDKAQIDYKNKNKEDTPTSQQKH